MRRPRTRGYDPKNRMMNVATGTTQVANYAYDPFGRRETKTVGSTITNFLNDGQDEIAEYDSSGDVLRRFVPGPAINEPVAYENCSGATAPKCTGAVAISYYHTDHHGSVVTMTDSTGNPIAGTTLTYDTYGNSNAPPTGQPLHYVGMYYDAETGLYYDRARYYSPTLGRFLQTDPIGYKDDIDLYTYVGNDPTDRTDPTGLSDEVDRYHDQENQQSLQTQNDDITGRLLIEIWKAIFGGKPAEPGSWVHRNESMSPAARAFQVSQGGRPDQAYLVNGVNFDGYVRGSLVEAKGSYAQFTKGGRFVDWFNGAKGLVTQAENQKKAAGDTPIVWRVADPTTQRAIQTLLKESNVTGISVQLAKHSCDYATRLSC